MNQTFTANQSAAINSDRLSILVVAGPGSGKTTVLAERIKTLIDEGLRPARIVALTYTNAAARNLEERLSVTQTVDRRSDGKTEIQTDTMSYKPLSLGFCGTLHGFALRMIKQHAGGYGYGSRTAVIDEEAAEGLLESRARALNCKTPAKKLLKLKAAGRPTGSRLSTDELVVVSYFDECRESGLLDFDLILSEFLRLLREELGFRSAIRETYADVFVDEVQDSAEIDWEIFRELPIESKFFVGDPDQAIFGFRGGRQDLMIRYAREQWVEVHYLQENFRCGPAICKAANQLIRRNTVRLEKETISADGHLDRVTAFGPTLNEGDEIGQVVGYLRDVIRRGVASDDVAILARSNRIATAFRETLVAAGIPVEDPPLVELPPDWSLARSLVELIAQPDNDTLAFFYFVAREIRRGASPSAAHDKAHTVRREASLGGRRLNDLWLGIPKDATLDEVPIRLDKEGISQEARMLIAEKIRSLPAGAGLLELALELARTNKGEEKPGEGGGVAVTTIHSAKGREWDLVFLVGFEDEVLPGTAKSANIEEERRVAFVGLTRARQSVYLSHATSRRASWGNNPIQEHKRSRYVAEMLGEALP